MQLNVRTKCGNVAALLMFTEKKLRYSNICEQFSGNIYEHFELFELELTEYLLKNRAVEHSYHMWKRNT